MSPSYVRAFRLIFKPTLLSCFLLSFAVSCFAFAAPYKPHEVKAAYLYQIANFVKWEDEATKTKLVFCIRDDLELKRTFAKLTQGKTIRGLEVVTQNSNRDCDVLYTQKVLFANDKSQHALTVSSTKGFAKHGGTIELSQTKNKIQPIVNLQSSKSDYFSISSKFMRISQIIRGG